MYTDQRYYLRKAIHPFKMGSLISLKLTNRLDWLASELQRSLCLAPHSEGTATVSILTRLASAA